MTPQIEDIYKPHVRFLLPDVGLDVGLDVGFEVARKGPDCRPVVSPGLVRGPTPPGVGRCCSCCGCCSLRAAALVLAIPALGSSRPERDVHACLILEIDPRMQCSACRPWPAGRCRCSLLALPRRDRHAREADRGAPGQASCNALCVCSTFAAKSQPRVIPKHRRQSVVRMGVMLLFPGAKREGSSINMLVTYSQLP